MFVWYVVGIWRVGVWVCVSLDGWVRVSGCVGMYWGVCMCGVWCKKVLVAGLVCLWVWGSISVCVFVVCDAQKVPTAHCSRAVWQCTKRVPLQLVVFLVYTAAIPMGILSLHCRTAMGRWAVGPFLYTPSLPGGSWQCASFWPRPHCQEAVGGQIPSLQCFSACGQWEVGPLWFTSSLPEGGLWVVELLCTAIA